MMCLHIVACESKEQRIVPTGVAAGGNEIKQHRNFSETHFLGVAPCGICLDRHGGNGVYLPTKKVGKNNSKAEQILEVKQSEIGQKAKASIQKFGRNPALLNSLIMTAIYEREQQLVNVKEELAGAKGIFKAKQCKELQEQAEQVKTQIANVKQYLSSIVQSYGYKNVKEFLAEYRELPKRSIPNISRQLRSGG